MSISNRINSCFIHLKDFEKGKAWYKKVLPFEIEAEGDTFLEFRMNGTGLILLQSYHNHITPLPYSVVSFETTDIDQVFQELRDQGIKTDGIEAFPAGMRGCHVYDPEGNKLLICTPPSE